MGSLRAGGTGYVTSGAAGGPPPDLHKHSKAKAPECFRGPLDQQKINKRSETEHLAQSGDPFGDALLPCVLVHPHGESRVALTGDGRHDQGMNSPASQLSQDSMSEM